MIDPVTTFAVAAAAITCGLGGYALGVVRTRPLASWEQARLKAEEDYGERLLCSASSLSADVLEAKAQLARTSDANGVLQARRDRALDQVTPGANATVKRMAAILKGEA